MTDYKKLLVLSEIAKEEEIFDYFYEGQITDVIIFTAYLDIQTLEDFRKFLNENAKKWPKKSAHYKNCNIRIFTDSSNKRLLDQLSNHEKRKYSWIENRYKKKNEDEDEHYRKSGIYFIKTGILFHPKCYLFTYANGESKILLGSMNFTQNGRRAKNKNGNEEFLLSISTNQPDEKQLAFEIKNDLYKYIKSNKEMIYKYAGPDTTVKNHSLRDFFLNGFLWYETKETDSLFRIPIKMTEKSSETEDSNKHYAIDDQHSQNYDIKKVITKITGENLTSKSAESQKQIKPYFLSTSVGNWSPKEFKKDIESILLDKSKAKLKEVKMVMEIFEYKFKALQEEIINDFLNNSQWGISEIKIKKHLKKLKNKLLSEPEDEEEFNSYCRRLIYPWSSYPMVDIWQDSLAVSEFEVSLENELYYRLRKERKSKIINFFTEQEINLDLLKFREDPIGTLKKYFSK